MFPFVESIIPQDLTFVNRFLMINVKNCMFAYKRLSLSITRLCKIHYNYLTTNIKNLMFRCRRKYENNKKRTLKASFGYYFIIVVRIAD